MSNDRAAYRFALANIRFRWRTYLLYSIASVLSIPVRFTSGEYPIGTVFAALLAGVTLTIITAPFLWLGFKLIGRLEENARRLLILSYLLIALFGLARGVLVHILLPLFGLQDSFSVIQSMISSTIFTFFFYNLASFTVELITVPIESFRQEFTKATIDRLKLNLNSTGRIDESEYLESMELMRKAIGDHLPTDSKVVPNQVEILAAAREIQTQIQDVLRPLSHRLWVGAFGEIKSLKIRQLSTDAISIPKFSVLFLLTYQFLLGTYGISLVSDLSSALKASIWGTAASAIIIIVFRFLTRQKERVSLLSGLIFLVTIGTVPIVLGALSQSEIFSWVRFLGGFLIVPTLPLVIFISSLYNLILDDKIFAVFAAKSIRLQQTALLRNRSDLINIHNLAGYVHNNLQSELLRISKQLELSATSQSPAMLDTQLNALSVALGRSLEDVAALRDAGLARLNSIVDAWSGIAEIVLKIPRDIELSAEKSKLLVDLVEEMITNSIRHGKAERITISVSHSGDALSVQLSHDGSIFSTEGSGLGSQWITQYSESKPELNVDRKILTYRLSI